MYFPTASAIDIVETLMPQFDALLDKWLEHINRKEPVPVGSARQVNALLISARRVLARAPATHNVGPVDLAKPVMPSDLFVAVLKAYTALNTFANRYSHFDDDGEPIWHTRTGTRCPLCHQPHVFE